MKKIHYIKVILIYIIIHCCYLQAGAAEAENVGSVASGDRLALQFPAIEYPFNFSDGYNFPGMYQSLHLTKSAGEAVHEGMGYLLNRQVGTGWTVFTIGLFDIFVLSYLPLGDAWLHEEWHRAVMSRRNISSFNDVYRLEFFAETISVSHVKDEDLVRLKRDYPADMVRLSEAGIESQYELVKASRLDYFFSGRPHTYQLPYWWLNILNSVFYIQFSGTIDADVETDKMNSREPTIEERDFVGFDFTAWVYDLFRPLEPYQDRGIHPSGTGIDRYIKKSDLTDEEKKYLKLQFRLSLLNLASPHLLGFNRFEWDGPGSRIYWNLALMHYLTSFGYTVDFHGMLKFRECNIDFTIHNYMNYNRYFPGGEVALSRYPVIMDGYRYFLSVKAGAWLQPENQEFMTTASRPGGLLGAGISLPVFEWINIFLNGEVKSEGWVAGHVSLEPAYRIVAGIEALL